MEYPYRTPTNMKQYGGLAIGLQMRLHREQRPHIQSVANGRDRLTYDIPETDIVVRGHKRED